MVITVWVQLLRGGENIGRADKITLEDDSSDVADLCDVVMKKFPISLAGVDAALLNVSTARESSEYLRPAQKLQVLPPTKDDEPLFVHAPALAGGSEQLDVEIERLKEVRLTEEARAEEAKAKARAEEAKAKAKARAEEAKAKARAEEAKARAEEAKAKARAEEARAEEATRDRVVVEARSKGVRGMSLTPSELCQAMEKVGKQVQHWFDSWDLQFNDVKVTVDEKMKPKKFEVDAAKKDAFFTQQNVSEKLVQAAWSSTFSSVFELAARQSIFWVDAHTTAWLNQPNGDQKHGKKPDAVAMGRIHGTLDAHFVIAFHDNKDSCNGRFTQDDRGKVFAYCVLVLEFYQQTRPFMPCSLFDGKYSQCFRVVRSRVPDHHPYYAEWSPVLDLSIREDAQRYAGFLLDRKGSGYRLSEIHPDADNMIGRGATSVVFSHKSDENCVIKVAYSQFDLRKERSVLKRIKGRSGILRLHEQDKKNDPRCLLLTPKLEAFVNLKQLLPLLVTLIDEQGQLRQLHTLGFVHCDVRPPNIMKATGNRRAALVDFGAVRTTEECTQYTHGTLAFASPRVRAAYSHESAICMLPTDDMVSFALCAIALYHNCVDDERLHTGIVAQIEECWDEITKISRFAADTLRLCSNNPPEYEAVCKHLTESIVAATPEL